MSNAAKHRKKAAEFEQLKQIDRAIAAYIRAIEDSETDGADVDVALLNKVGDLTLRQGRVADAVTYYERAVEHYATAGLFNNAIALCNKILRSAPGRANVYFTLGRICAKKGLRGDATRNFLEYATRMQQESRVDEGMRALAEVADLMPELTEVRRLVEEHAVRAGIVLPRRKTPVPVAEDDRPRSFENRSSELVFLDIGSGAYPAHLAPPVPRAQTPARPAAATSGTARTTPARTTPARTTPARPTTGRSKSVSQETQSLDDFMLFDPTLPDTLAPLDVRPLTPADSPTIDGPREPVIETALETELETELEPTEGAIAEMVGETVDEIPVAPLVDVQPEADLEATAAVSSVEPVEAVVTPIDGLEANGDFDGAAIEAIDGFTSDDIVEPIDGANVEPEVSLTWLMPPESDDVTATIRDDDEVAAEDLRGVETDVIADLMVEDFDHVADNPEVVAVMGTTSDTPTYTSSPISLTPIEVFPVVELDRAIEAGALAAAIAEADAQLTARRPPFRLDPHDFILPGELPPLMVEDDLAFAGMQFAIDAVDEALTSSSTDFERDQRVPPEAVDAWLAATEPDAPVFSVEAPVEAAVETADETPVEATVEAPVDALSVDADIDALDASISAPVDEPEIAAAIESASNDLVAPVEIESDRNAAVDEEPDAAPHEAYAEAEFAADAESATEAEEVGDVDDEVESLLRETIESDRAVHTTPSLHIAAVAAEANAVATSRRDELHTAVARAPHDWTLRRRLAEALFEVGEREGALTELQTAVSGFAQAGDLEAAAEIADQLVRIAPERIAYHQKRVELAVRLSDQQRLRAAYLDLGDILVRIGDDVRGHAVYARVLEIDPWDERARAALGAAAPPPPPKPAETPSEEFVNLSDWLAEDEPATTRMRMREPQVSGDEQADFDSLLRHFKEGVARSLGEEDFESHYDLGVAYKEMGLLDDAIAEFQKALRSRRHRLPAYEALGQCFVEQSRHSVAATVLSRALHEPGPGDEQRVGVLYLLAYSCEALQRWDEARSYYSRVYATDIHFRDVAARLAALDLIAR